MISKASADDEKVKILKMVEEGAWEGVDLELATKIVDEIFESHECVADSVADTAVMMSFMSISQGNTEDFLTPCGEASLSLTIDVIGLFMSLLGLPGSIGKRVAVKIVGKAKKRLVKEVVRIAREYFQNAGNLLLVATGLVELFGVLLSIFSPTQIIDIIFGEMTYYEIAIYSVLITTNIALLFAASAPAIVVKLALVTPDVIDVVRSTVDVVEKCD